MYLCALIMLSFCGAVKIYMIVLLLVCALLDCSTKDLLLFAV